MESWGFPPHALHHRPQAGDPDCPPENALTSPRADAIFSEPFIPKDRHPGAGRGPAKVLKESGIPAFAGMTVEVVKVILKGGIR